MQAWMQVADAAAQRGHRLGKTLAEIARTFSGARPSEFIPPSQSWRVPARRPATHVLQLPLARRVSDSVMSPSARLVP
jgi:hypothetical protein